MSLHRRVGSHKHREWAWVIVGIMVVAAVVVVWGSQEPKPAPVAIKESPKAGSSKTADTSVIGVLAGIPEASTFNSYFVGTKVAASFGKGPYTIFVPNNAAFANAPKGSVSGLSASAQKRLVEYHIVAGKALDTDAVSSGSVQAVSRDYINFVVDLKTGASYVNSGKVLSTHKAKNGVVYVISSVLFPPVAR